MGSPDVSIVTAAYNAAAYIERALESVRRGTIDRSRVEHIVVDDASTDGTAAIVDAFDAPYVHLVENERNVGGTEACNRGIESARGEYVVVLDSDDEFLPLLVERSVGVLRARPNIDFVYCDYYERFPDGERVVDTGEEVLNTVKVGIAHRIEHLRAFGAYDPEMVFAEYDLLLRYLDAGLEGFHIPEPLFVYHRRANSVTGDSARVAASKTELKEKFGEDVRVRGYDI